MCKTRNYKGVPLVKVDDAHYKTPDGEFEIYRDDEFETECMDPHPCRLTKKMREAISRYYYDYSMSERDRKRYAVAQYGPDAFEAWASGKKGWYCYGNETHYYSQWVAWTGSDRDWSGEWVDTFTEALSDLKAHLDYLKDIDAVPAN